MDLNWVFFNLRTGPNMVFKSLTCIDILYTGLGFTK